MSIVLKRDTCEFKLTCKRSCRELCLGTRSLYSPITEERKMLVELLELTGGITPWELQFIERMSHQTMLNGQERIIIRRIYARNFRGVVWIQCLS